jgi:hypothetical protein
LTSHAIDRFQEYVMPSSSRGRARAEAIAVSMSARRTEERTALGQDVWVATDGVKVRFVVKLDGSARICVTCLRPAEDGITDEELLDTGSTH